MISAKTLTDSELKPQPGRTKSYRTIETNPTTEPGCFGTLSHLPSPDSETRRRILCGHKSHHSIRPLCASEEQHCMKKNTSADAIIIYGLKHFQQ